MTVLLLASLLLVMLVGLLSMSSEEAERSRMSVEGERSSGLVEIALAEVRAKLMDGGEIPYKGGVARASMTACPGLLEVRRYDVLPNRGYQVGREAFMDENSFFRKPFAREYERSGEGDWQPANPQWIALYSQKWYAPLCRYMTVGGEVNKEDLSRKEEGNPDYNPERVFNLNTKDNPFAPGKFYLGGESGKSVGVKSVDLRGKYAQRGREEPYRYQPGESSVERPLYVQWMPIYKNPQYGAVLPNGESNPIVGRYAYWVDVENTKINLQSVEREWEKTRLGQLTGRSNAEAKRRERSYFQQWGEKEGETPRYAADAYKPRTYRLFRDKLPTDYGVTLYYRPNYEKREKNDQSQEAYMRRVFGWEKKNVPPAIADTSVVDRKAFSALRTYEEGARGAVWLEKIRLGGEYNVPEEIRAVLDPAMEKWEKRRRGMAMSSLEKMYGQVLTPYGWEEERDPLGRPKLDINAILREGDSLFDQGKGLPQPDHHGTALQQFLARTEDPMYYSAYYPGAYPGGGKNLSYVDGLKAFAGRGADVDGYAKAMRDQQVVNLIEYGRDPHEPPYRDAKRGIIGAKSMPYVAEVAIRARNAFWDYWDYTHKKEDGSSLRYKPYAESVPDFDENVPFPGVYEKELAYQSEFELTKKGDLQDRYLLQKLANDFLGFSTDLTSNNDRFTADSKFFSIGGYTPRNKHFFLALLSHLVVDMAFAFVNPNPFGKDQEAEWELEVGHYMNNTNVWADINASEMNPLYYYSSTDLNRVLGFDQTEGEYDATSFSHLEAPKIASGNDHYSAYLFPGNRRCVDCLGYFFGRKGDSSSEHSIAYYRERPVKDIDSLQILFLQLGWIDLADIDTDNLRSTGLFPGDLLDGIDPGEFNEEMDADTVDRVFFQPFRLVGWRIKKKGATKYHHIVPLRHPGQRAPPRHFWQMTVDPDGEGPLLPPNAGVLASTRKSKHGFNTEETFNYADFHSLEHFRQPSSEPIRNIGQGDIAAPFGLGIDDNEESWKGLKNGGRGLRDRRNVAASWFSSQTIAEFEKYGKSLLATIPPQRGQTYTLYIRDRHDEGHIEPFKCRAADAPYFYHIEEELVARGDPPFRGLEGLLYLPERAIKIYNEWATETAEITDPNYLEVLGYRYKYRSDVLRFILLQMKLRDEGKHHREVVRATGRSQQSTGREEDDDFVEGMALVERLVCIDPVIGHRTGNPDLRITRNGQTYSGHFYGINGHPWRRYHYYFHHYDKDSNSPQAEVLGDNVRPEPDQCLTQYFNDPRRTDGISEVEYSDTTLKVTWGNQEVSYQYTGFKKRTIPQHALTGSVLWNALLTGGVGRPELGGEKGWSEVSDVEESGVNVWPYGVGMNLNFTYGNGETSQSANDRFNFRNGSFLTHAPRGELMISIGEIGMCHSGFMQRAIDLDRPPLFSSKGVKRLGAPQYGPPLNMLLDLIVPSNFQNSEGQYLSERDWNRGKYRVHSPQNPRRGTWNVNSKIAHDNYLAIREGGHGELSNRVEVFFSEEIDRVAVHPALVPSAVTRQSVERAGERGQRALDPYLSPLIRFRRGWEHWLGAIAGDYSEYRNLGEGVWNKQVRGTRKWGAEGAGNRVYDIAQGVRSFSWSPGGKQRGVQSGNKRSSLIGFDKRETNTGNLLVLGREAERGVGGHVSGDGPIYRGRKSVYPVERGTSVSMYDVTRYGIFPLYHHISEVGYSGVGEIYTALNHRNRTTSALGGFVFEEELIDEQRGGDGMLGAMSQAGFGRNASWVMVGNQASTSANVFTVHIVVQSLRDRGELLDGGKEGREERESIISSSEDVLRGIGLMDRGDEILGEQWAQVTIARLPRRDKHGEIQTDKEGAPQYDYRVLSRKIVENVQ